VLVLVDEVAERLIGATGRAAGLQVHRRGASSGWKRPPRVLAEGTKMYAVAVWLTSSPVGQEGAMGYPHSVAGNEGSRSDRDDALVLDRVAVARRFRGPEPALAVAVGVILAVAVLILKPWSIGGPSSRGDVATQPAPGASVAAEAGPSAVVRPEPDAAVAADGAARSVASPPPSAYIENLDPIEPDRWAHLSATLRTTNADGVVVVARYPDGLYYGFFPTAPSELASAQPAGRADAPTNVARVTGYLANPVAIGITRAIDEPAPLAIGWQVLGPGRQVRLTLRHPVGDLDRYLFLGPGIGLPPGERRNRREISRWPPVWQAGVYRFDLTTESGTRYVFVDLEP
jgi:hypothetical protein